MSVEHLIDISVFNPVNNWAEVADNGIVGASIKVSQQVNYLNPLRGAQVAGARGVGIAPGGYHFGDPRVSPASQAQFFVNNARPLGLFDDDALAPMYDAEHWDGVFTWTKAQINAHIPEHIRVVREETGVRKHFVYASLSWWQSGFLDVDAWADEDVLLWIAVYNGDPGNLQGWSHPNDALHQHTSDGIVDGIPGRVDKNTTLRDRRIGGLLIRSEDTLPSLDDLKKMPITMHPEPTDPDQRPEVEFEEVVSWNNKAAWLAADTAVANGIKLDALLGRDPVDEAELARQLLAQGLNAQLGRIPDDQFDALVVAINNDADRRARIRANANLNPIDNGETGQ